MKQNVDNCGQRKQAQLLWNSLEAVRHVFKMYQHITGIKVQVFMNGNTNEPSYTYEDKR